MNLEWSVLYAQLRQMVGSKGLSLQAKLELKLPELSWQSRLCM